MQGSNQIAVTLDRVQITHGADDLRGCRDADRRNQFQSVTPNCSAVRVDAVVDDADATDWSPGGSAKEASEILRHCHQRGRLCSDRATHGATPPAVGIVVLA